MEQKIQTALIQIFGEELFVQARVIGYYETAYRSCVQIKEEIEDLRYYKELNFQNWPQRAKVADEQDAEEFHEKRILDLKRKVSASVRETEETNMGKAFLMFSDPQVVKCLSGLGQEYF